MGPIGLFFARFCRYLQGCGIPVTKVAFPLREFGFPADVCVPYSKGMDSWRPFLRRLIEERGIRHIFMYGDFIIPHRIAIEEARNLGVEAWVFELGYLRPNYVTLERDRVNAAPISTSQRLFIGSYPRATSCPRTSFSIPVGAGAKPGRPRLSFSTPSPATRSSKGSTNFSLRQGFSGAKCVEAGATGFTAGRNNR